MDHLTANRIVREAWLRVHGREATDSEAALLQAVGWGESAYGRAPGQHAAWAAQGLYTWGNLETHRLPDGGCPPGTYPGRDAGNQRCFYLWPTDLGAAEAMVKNITKNGSDAPGATARARAFAERTRAIMEALATGSPEIFAEAMKHPAEVAYYEAPSATYGKLLRDSLRAIARQVPVPEVSIMAPAKSPWPLVILAVSAVGLYTLTRKRGLAF